MYTVVLLLHVIIAIALITLVLLQQGRGAEAGAAFGSGASSTVFGSRGSASFLSRVTGSLAAGFFITSLALAFFINQTTTGGSSVVERLGTANDNGTVIETPALSEPAGSDVPAPADVGASDVPSATAPTPAPANDTDSSAAAAAPSDVPVPQPSSSDTSGASAPATE